ncbi:MAG: DNA repair protein RecO [Lachnospiraceae bacterium]|nr:DNA repair protein RecO [Lachnospiraceae bacterium]
MQEMVTVTGMVLSQTPIGEYDRRVCILTKERGKISAFAKGARRQNSRLMASTNPFSFGQFKLYQGKTSYNIMEASIDQYYETLREDFVGAYYGMYFLEIADFYTRENNDEIEMLKLLYQSMKALVHPTIDNRLVRCIYEIKAVVVNGEFPGLPSGRTFDDSTIYTVEYIASSSIEKLFTFQVSEKVLLELSDIGNTLRERFFQKEYKSLEILETLIS